MHAKAAAQGLNAATQAVGLAEPTDYLDTRGDVQVGWAEVLRVVGKPGKAIRALRHATELYERKGNVVSAARAREALADLSAVES